MSQVIFTIDSKDYPIGCPESQKPRLEKLAEMVKTKEKEVLSIMGSTISHDMLLVMMIVAFTDELDRKKSEPTESALDTTPVVTEIHELIQIVKQMKSA